MKKKGFTLIELLAIIIILAIVALVATPIIINVVDDARDKAAFIEASAFVDGIQKGCRLAELEDPDFTGCGATIAATEAKNYVDFGNASLIDTVSYSNGKVTSLKISSNGRVIVYDGTTYTKSSK